MPAGHPAVVDACPSCAGWLCIVQPCSFALRLPVTQASRSWVLCVPGSMAAAPFMSTHACAVLQAALHPAERQHECPNRPTHAPGCCLLALGSKSGSWTPSALQTAYPESESWRTFAVLTPCTELPAFSRPGPCQNQAHSVHSSARTAHAQPTQHTHCSLHSSCTCTAHPPTQLTHHSLHSSSALVLTSPCHLDQCSLLAPHPIIILPRLPIPHLPSLYYPICPDHTFHHYITPSALTTPSIITLPHLP